MITQHVKKTFNDSETQREQNRNSLSNQQKKILSTKEGVIVNSYVKDSINNNINDILGNYIIPQKDYLPTDIYQTEDKKNENKSVLKKLLSSSLAPLCITTLGILSGAAVITKILHNSAKVQTKLPSWKKLQELPRNMNLLSESHFVTYNAVQNPNVKNTLGAIAVFAFSGAAFIMKNFVDGFKDIWIKKQEIQIERDLQESLIEVETKSFAGKNQIIRKMMREKSEWFKDVINNIHNKKNQIPSVFKGVCQSVNFNGNKKIVESTNEPKMKKFKYIVAGILTLGLSILLTKKINKNIRATASEFKNYTDNLSKRFANILEKSPKDIIEQHKKEVADIITTLNFEPTFAKQQLEKAKISKDEIDKIMHVVNEKSKRFVPPVEAIGGRKGIQYYSYIDDVNGHFYNWIMNLDDTATSKITKNLFFALTAVTGIGYIGKTSIEAFKDVEVKKYNTETELELHKKLIKVELMNFKSKKNSSIEPLCDEFNRQAVQNKSTKELSKMADEILYEIKNGAPFVYS